MDSSEYNIIDARFRSVFDRYAAQLSEESRKSVRHYIDVAEVEMACESLVLAMLDEGVAMTSDSKSELLSIALDLRLDKESVFHSDFWQLAHPFLGGEK